MLSPRLRQEIPDNGIVETNESKVVNVVLVVVVDTIVLLPSERLVEGVPDERDLETSAPKDLCRRLDECEDMEIVSNASDEDFEGCWCGSENTIVVAQDGTSLQVVFARESQNVMQILGYSLIKGHLDVGEWLQDFFDVNDRRLRPLWTSGVEIPWSPEEESEEQEFAHMVGIFGPHNHIPGAPNSPK
ncbi:hypothetical protein AK812_SmicGene4106 [Symbiodinium microadriaticum]|uniref:Uncharacterized protein n=1 Tax=Symbiodinium microadriaticum TaxID=2951 RepID=A0A1Q9EX56_SYMMI|nr:hypothetical protein AK812_SmicGene4106 [Symbiodinium microadriaticum]